jgi:hypothetical protein
MLGNKNYSDESRNSGDLARLIPAVAIVVMTVASWVGVVAIANQAAQQAPRFQVTSEIVYDSMGGR